MSITPTSAKAGTTLTATSEVISGNFTFSGDFTWESADSNSAATGTPVTTGVGGTNKSQLTLDASLKNKYVRAKRNDVASDWVGPVQDEDPPPQPGTVRINDDSAVLGTTITASSLDDETANILFSGDFTWQYWSGFSEPYESGEYNWKTITEGVAGTNNNNSLALNAALNGKYIRVTRSTATGETKKSQPLLVVNTPPTVEITGVPKVGAMLTAVSAGQGFSGDYTWECADSKDAQEWKEILLGFSGENKSNLSIGSTVNIAGNPTASLVGKFIRARRTSAAAYTPVKSNILGAVTDASGNTGGSGTGSSNPIDDLLDAIGGAAGGTGGTAGFGAAGNAASKAAQPVREVLDSRERSYADAGLSSGW